MLFGKIKRSSLLKSSMSSCCLSRYDLYFDSISICSLDRVEILESSGQTLIKCSKLILLKDKSSNADLFFPSLFMCMSNLSNLFGDIYIFLTIIDFFISIRYKFHDPC